MCLLLYKKMAYILLLGNAYQTIIMYYILMDTFEFEKNNRFNETSLYEYEYFLLFTKAFITHCTHCPIGGTLYLSAWLAPWL